MESTSSAAVPVPVGLQTPVRRPVFHESITHAPKRKDRGAEIAALVADFQPLNLKEKFNNPEVNNNHNN